MHREDNPEGVVCTVAIYLRLLLTFWDSLSKVRPGHLKILSLKSQNKIAIMLGFEYLQAAYSTPD